MSIRAISHTHGARRVWNRLLRWTLRCIVISVEWEMTWQGNNWVLSDVLHRPEIMKAASERGALRTDSIKDLLKTCWMVMPLRCRTYGLLCSPDVFRQDVSVRILITFIGTGHSCDRKLSSLTRNKISMLGIFLCHLNTEFIVSYFIYSH